MFIILNVTNYDVYQTPPSFHLFFIKVSFQVKLENRNQMISNNFYFRGDGTVSSARVWLPNFIFVELLVHVIKFWWLLVDLQCSFYFSEHFLSNLFVEAGFCIVDMNTYCRQVENRSRNMTFHRYNQNACPGHCTFAYCLKLAFTDIRSCLLYKKG